MKLVSYNPAHKEAWNEFVKTAKNGLFMFDRNYMDYHADRFTDHSLMVFDENDRLLALLPANLRDHILYSHQGLTFGGLITNSSMKAATMLQVFELLKVYLKENGIKKLVYKAIPHIYHTHPAEEDLYALFRMGAVPFRVDVTTTINLRDRLNFADLRKRGIKKADKNGVTYQQSHNWVGYMNLLAAVLAEKHGTKPVHSAAEMELLSGRFPEALKLYTAEKDGQILAGVVVFEYAKLVHSQYIAASPEGRDCGALDGLFNHLISEVYAQKDWFDFGISTEEAGTILNEGLIAQKEGFGGRAVIHQFFELGDA